MLAVPVDDGRVVTEDAAPIPCACTLLPYRRTTRRVLGALAAGETTRGRPLGRAAMAEALGYPLNTVKSAVRRLSERGAVDRDLGRQGTLRVVRR